MEMGRSEIEPRVRSELLARVIPARFFYYFEAAEDLLPVRVGSVDNFVRFGSTRDGSMVCISAADMSIWELSTKVGIGRSLVNSSLDSFLRVMAICEEWISGHERVDDDEEELGEEFIERWVETSEAIRDRVERIDPECLFEGSYWSDFLSDVANGDYE